MIPNQGSELMMCKDWRATLPLLLRAHIVNAEARKSQCLTDRPW